MYFCSQVSNISNPRIDISRILNYNKSGLNILCCHFKYSKKDIYESSSK